MKNKRGLGKTVIPLSRQELEALPSGALLARLRRLRECEEARENSDLDELELGSASHLILFKADPAWRSAYAQLKEVLAKREHVTHKP